MKIKFMRQKEDDLKLGANKGDILIVDMDYSDSEKVEVLAILSSGSAPSMSQYKENLERITPEDLYEFLTSTEDEGIQDTGVEGEDEEMETDDGIDEHSGSDNGDEDLGV